ncbi:MAG: heavy metal-binding domain-containing protein [Flavobacteriaceae bacterium]
MSELTHCPNCKNELKGGLMSSAKLLDPDKTNIINEYHNKKSEAYCNKCGKKLFGKYKSALFDEKYRISCKLQKFISIIPVISTHSPLNWDYNILEMVTGQSTTGTGVISEFTSSFTDLFGAQSGRHNKKLKSGEDMCFAQLRKQALDLGGNAVIATDIDYSELGAGKGMIMVCMAGTAVQLKNSDVLGQQKAKQIDELVSLNDRLRYLGQFQLPEY